MRIFVIEDQPSELKLASHVLTNAGHEVSGIESADGALQTIRRIKPELIVLDMLVPGLDSLQLVQTIRADPELSAILVVAVTSYPEHFPRAAALAAGCDAYLVKPLSTRSLPGELEQLAAQRDTGSAPP